MQTEYTEAQIKDIKERELKGLQALKDLSLTPSAQLTSVNTGGDIFATKVTPFLQDLKYMPKQEDSTPEKDEPTPEPKKQ